VEGTPFERFVNAFAMASLSNHLTGDFYKQYENDLRNGTTIFKV
jgi:hypothetical protein